MTVDGIVSNNNNNNVSLTGSVANAGPVTIVSEDVDAFGERSFIHGDTVVTSSWDASDTPNPVHVYRKVDGEWVLKQTIPSQDEEVGEENEEFVNIAVYGNTIVLGVPGANNYSGKIYVYVTDDYETWSLQQTLTTKTGDYLGFEVSIYEDTLTAPFTNSPEDQGIVIFDRVDGVWSLTQTIQTTLDPVTIQIYGDTIAFAYNTTSYLDIYTRVGGTWELQQSINTVEIVHSVSLYEDTLAVTCNQFKGNTGGVRIYTRTDDTWELQQSLESDGSTNQLGLYCSIYDDTLIVGVYGVRPSAWVYKKINDTWVLAHILQRADSETSGDHTSVCVYDGAYVWSNSQSGNGVMYIYDSSKGTDTDVLSSDLINTTLLTVSTSNVKIDQGTVHNTALSGTATLVGGTVLVGEVGGEYLIPRRTVFLSVKETGGTPGILSYARVSSEYFRINSTSDQDTSTVDWFIVTGNFTPTSWSQPGSKLVTTDYVGSAYMGQAVSLSADGSTLAVGGYGDDGSIGATWIFKRAGSTWAQQGSKLVGTGRSGASLQGSSVSLSSDGNTLAVGGWGDNEQTGAVWVFTRTGTTWSQQGSKLVGSGVVGGARQGFAVSLSADGNTIAIGGKNDNDYAGATWIFTRSGETWSQQGYKLVGTGNTGAATQGCAVSLSSDGNTLAVGGRDDDSEAGATWIFTRSDGVWSQQGSKLVGTGASGSANQGHSVSLSSDGDTLAVGGFADDSFVGATWIFTRTEGVWSQQGSKLVGTGATGNALQGWSVSLSADGNTLASSGEYDNSEIGAVWVFTRGGEEWTQFGSKLIGTARVGNSAQGYSVSLSQSENGNFLASGGYLDNTDVGAVWVFNR
jgi:hypothetical protein